MNLTVKVNCLCLYWLHLLSHVVKWIISPWTITLTPMSCPYPDAVAFIKAWTRFLISLFLLSSMKGNMLCLSRDDFSHFVRVTRTVFITHQPNLKLKLKAGCLECVTGCGGVRFFRTSQNVCVIGLWKGPKNHKFQFLERNKSKQEFKAQECDTHTIWKLVFRSLTGPSLSVPSPFSSEMISENASGDASQRKF